MDIVAFLICICSVFPRQVFGVRVRDTLYDCALPLHSTTFLLRQLERHQPIPVSFPSTLIAHEGPAPQIENLYDVAPPNHYKSARRHLSHQTFAKGLASHQTPKKSPI